MELKAWNILTHEYHDCDDFHLIGEAWIGPDDQPFVYRVYNFDVISIKRLYDGFADCGIMLNWGWMITKYYDEAEILQKLNAIIRLCTSQDEETTYSKLEHYLRLQEADR